MVHEERGLVAEDTLDLQPVLSGCFLEDELERLSILVELRLIVCDSPLDGRGSLSRGSGAVLSGVGGDHLGEVSELPCPDCRRV